MDGWRVFYEHLPLSPTDLVRLRGIAADMQFELMCLPPEIPQVAELRTISSARTVAELMALRGQITDNSPTFACSVAGGQAYTIQSSTGFCKYRYGIGHPVCGKLNCG